MDGALLSVGADIQFRIWNPVMSVIAVQDLNASTRLTAQNAMTYTLGKKTAREVQLERVKLGERLGVRGLPILQSFRQSSLIAVCIRCCLMTQTNGITDGY